MKKHMLLAASVLTNFAAGAPAWSEVSIHHLVTQNSGSMMGVISSRHMEEMGTSIRNYSMLARLQPGEPAPQETIGTQIRGLDFRGAMLRRQFPALTPQYSLISSLHGTEIGSGGTAVAMQMNQLHPILSAQPVTHFGAGNTLLQSHIGKSTNGDCADGSTGKLRQAYMINLREPILRKSDIISRIATLDDLSSTTTGKFRRYGFDINHLSTLDPRILRSLSGTDFGTRQESTDPASLGTSFNVRPSQLSSGGKSSKFGVHVDFTSLPKIQIPTSFDHHANGSSSQYSFDESHQPRHSLSFEGPSKLKTLTSLSYGFDYNSSQIPAVGQGFTPRFNYRLDDTRNAQTPSLSPTLGVSSAKSIFDPNCFGSQFKYAHLNLSSLTSTQVPKTTSVPTFQLSYPGARTLTPFIQPVLPTMSSSTLFNGGVTFGSSGKTASPTENGQFRELVLMVRPHVAF